MGTIYMGGGGGGADTSIVTATAGDILKGLIFVNPDGEPITGTLELTGDAAAGNVLKDKTFYNTNAKSKQTGSMVNRGAGGGALAVNGTYTIAEGYYDGTGKVTQALTTKAAATYRASTSAQTISANQYLTGAQTIAAVTQSNLSAANVKKGVTINISNGSTNIWSIAGSYVSPYIFRTGNNQYNIINKRSTTVSDGSITASGDTSYYFSAQTTCSLVGYTNIVLHFSSYVSGKSSLGEISITTGLDNTGTKYVICDTSTNYGPFYNDTAYNGARTVTIPIPSAAKTTGYLYFNLHRAGSGGGSLSFTCDKIYLT